MRPLRTLVTACLALALFFPAAAQASSPPKLMLSKINEVRARHGLRALHPSPSLNASATRYSSWLMQADYFGHRNRIRMSRRFRRRGEILALHRGDQAQIAATVDRWMRSPSHRAVILHRGLDYFGAGMTVGRFRGWRATIWVGHFGAR